MLRHLLLSVVMAIATYNAHASPRSVVVYTTSQIALTQVPPEAKIVMLDRLQQIEAQMSQGLPANPQHAALIVKQRMNSAEWLRLQAELRPASEGVAQARSAGIRNVPAVTVDGTHVVYGISNVAAALQQIEQARARP
ncbi:TIGR03757 family integrating conjugative element protein [Stutzerimonas stutzeri]